MRMIESVLIISDKLIGQLDDFDIIETINSIKKR